MHLLKSQVEDFMQDPVWLEIIKTWKERKKSHITEILDGCNATGERLTPEDIHYRRGQIKDLEFSMIQPELLIDEIEEDEASKPESKLEDDNNE